MSKDEIPQLIQAVLYAQHHHLLDDTVGRSAMWVFDHGVADKFVQNIIHERVRKHKIAQAFIGPFELPRLKKGELIQGFDIKHRPTRIPIQYLNAHSLTLASSGAGKTTKAYFHVLQIAHHIKGLWLFDCAKREWQKIKQLLTRIGVDLIVLPARSMKFNPLQVPLGVDPLDWIPRISDTLVMVMELPPRASKLLQSVLHRLFRKMGVVGKETPHTLYPTLYDVLHEVKQDKGANPQARHALLDSLDSLLASLGPDVLAYRRGWPIHELAKLPINYVLGGIADVALDLILNTLLIAEFSSRVARSISNPLMDLYISVDEGQRIVSTTGSYRNALGTLWPLIRGTGIGLDISIPTSHGLMPQALSFSATRYLGRCSSAADYELVGRSMGMSKAQLDYVFHHTNVGRFIAQVSEGEFRYPYVLDIPAMRFPKERSEPREDTGQLKRLQFVQL